VTSLPEPFVKTGPFRSESLSWLSKQLASRRVARLIGKQIALIQVPNQALFSLKAAARYLGISPDTLLDDVDHNRILCFTFHGRRTFKLEDLEFLRESLRQWENQPRPTSASSERTA
jgi:hypothetical protein